MFLTICLSSTLQKTVSFPSLTVGEVNRSSSYRLDASGKALNTARVLNQLERGCVVSVCPLGKENADLFMKLANDDGLKIKSVSIPGFTRECVTLLDDSGHSTTELVVGEPNVKFDVSNVEKNFLQLIEDELSKTDAVILAGSRPVCWGDDLQARICEIVMGNKISDPNIVAEAGGKTSQLDRQFGGRPILLADFCGTDLIRTLEVCTPDIIKINEEEFCKTFGFSFPLAVDELKNKITEKSAELKNIIIITRGASETFAAKNGEFYSCPTEKVNAVNTIACGDSFNAGFIFEYVKSGNMMKSLQKGTWCAARNAESLIPGSIREPLKTSVFRGNSENATL